MDQGHWWRGSDTPWTGRQSISWQNNVRDFGESFKSLNKACNTHITTRSTHLLTLSENNETEERWKPH